MKLRSVILSELNQYELELSNFKRNDSLVDISLAQVHPYTVQIEALTPQISKLLKEATLKERNEGFYPLCLAEGTFIIAQASRNQQIPVFIHLLSPKLNPIQGTVQWNVNEEEWLLNPYIIQLLSFEEASFEEKSKEETLEMLTALGYHVDHSSKYIGNFHPYRHALLKEIASLKKNADLSHFEFLYDGNQQTDKSVAQGIVPLIYESDHTQHDAIRMAESNSAVIQGPPGTGKSQVITNLIGRLLKQQKRILVSSQKREALEVVAEKLAECGLGELSLIRNSTDGVKAVINGLKESWETLDKLNKDAEITQLSDLSLNWYQGLLNTYYKKGLIGQLSPKDFIQHSGILNKKIGAFHAGLPSYDVWLEHKAAFNNIPKEVIYRLSRLNPDLSLSTSYEAYLVRWKNIQKTLENLGWEALTYDAILQKHHTAYVVNLFSNETSQRCLPWMKHRKRIDRILQRLSQLEGEITNDNNQLSAWKTAPTSLELRGIAKALNGKSVFRRIQLNRIKSQWLREPTCDIASLIKITEQHHLRCEEKSTHYATLLTMGFQNPNVDINAYRTFSTLYDGSMYLEYQGMSKAEQHLFGKHYQVIQDLVLTLKSNFRFDAKEHIHAYLGQLTSFECCLPHLASWEKISRDLRQCVGLFEDILVFEEAIIASDWHRFLGRFPGIDELISTSQANRLSDLDALRKGDQNVLVMEILQQRKAQFDSYHRLIATPKGQLSNEEQALKKSLIEGKRILAKLFSRQRKFPSLKEIMRSEASIWIQLLKPVWFSSPVNVAMDLPLEKTSIDVAIIDEASQLLLSHSLGIIYRTGHVVIAGDRMQMAPSHFFERSTKGLTLLDQATFNLPQCQLMFHYRSQQPGLIEFSNRHFYQNSLITLPSYPAYNAITSIYTPNCTYNEGINVGEAKVAKELLMQRMRGSADSIGLVAFSEKQLKTIIDQCTTQEVRAIDSAQETGRLFLKTLDQIQGDECDEIIISFGYGKNEFGAFEQRFGPLNNEGGDKRLNVLLSRTRKHLYFVHSVSSSDFSMNENPSIHLLKKWFEYLENSTTQQIQMPLEVVSSHENILTISNWLDLSSSLLDLLTYRSVLTKRGWIIQEVGSSLERGHTRVLPLDGSVKSA